MAGRYDQVRISFRKRVAELRVNPEITSAHAQTPDMIANLIAAFEVFLQFGLECGVVDDLVKSNLWERCWTALVEVANAQAKHQAVTEPARRFISLLHSCLSSGRAHLASREGHCQEKNHVGCGWRDSVPLGKCIGWIEGNDVYLDVTTAYGVAQITGRDAGEPLAISEQMLKRRLKEKGVLASIDKARETLTIRRKITGSSKDVLHFHRTTFLPTDSDAPDDPSEEIA